MDSGLNLEDIRAYKLSRAVETEEIIYRTGREEGTMIQNQGQRKTRNTNMAAHSSVLAWKIPWMEEPGRLQSMGLQRVRHD